MKNTPKAYLHTLGCRLNQSETTALGNQLRAQGFQLVQSPEFADWCVINTCTVTEQADAKNRQLIRSMRRQNSKVKVAVTGCYAQMAPDLIKQIEGVQLVVGNAEKMKLPQFLQTLPDESPPTVINPRITRQQFEEPVFDWQSQRTRAHLKIQDGCDFMCSFCIIPFSRGRSRARTLENLMQEAHSLLEAGVREIVLTGVNLGTFEEGPHTLKTVVEQLNSLPEIRRIRISSIEPTTVQPELLEWMADPAHKLVPFLHLPLQSGDNPILELMKRRYSREEYINEVLNAHGRVRDLCVGTDVMVGFPGEDESRFQQTVSLLEELPIAYFHVFPYSERPGTPAIRMPGQVSSQEKQRRVEVLRQLSDRKRDQFQQRFLGTHQQVLFESTRSNGEIEGYTENYIRVKLKTSPHQSLKNQLRTVQLTGLEGNKMVGELV